LNFRALVSPTVDDCRLSCLRQDSQRPPTSRESNRRPPSRHLTDLFVLAVSPTFFLRFPGRSLSSIDPSEASMTVSALLLYGLLAASSRLQPRSRILCRKPTLQLRLEWTDSPFLFDRRRDYHPLCKRYSSAPILFSLRLSLTFRYHSVSNMRYRVDLHFGSLVTFASSAIDPFFSRLTISGGMKKADSRASPPARHNGSRFHYVDYILSFNSQLNQTVY